MKSIKVLFAFAAIVAIQLAYGQCGPLATAYNQNNGQDGIMFDVQAITSVEITSWDINCGGTTHTFEIYYRPGTHVGFQNNAAGWTLLGTAAGVNGPVNVATPIPIPISVILCAGDVGAFYITSTSTSGSIDYTNGPGVGTVIASDANLQIKCGTGKDYPFAASFTPRSPNVTAHYNCLSLSCCAAQSITATPGACAGGVYSTTGTFTFLNPPAGGQLIVEDCNGVQQVFSPPFTSPLNYTLTGQNPNGLGCDVTAYFTSDPSCTVTQTYTAPMCACDASWTVPTPVCSTDPSINLSALITGDTGGNWSGTGVTGSSFNPASGTQSVTYTAPLGCTSVQTITVTPTATATWTIPTGLCDSGSPIDLSTYITGTTGGTWSGTGITGSMFDPSVGTQSITYTVGTAPCDDAVTQTITVTPQADATWTIPPALCTTGSPVDLNTYITGTTGGTWSGTGVTGNMFDPSNGSQTITYTVGTAPCDDVLSQLITVVSNADASWTIPTGLCDSGTPIDLSTYVTGTAGGTWSGTGITGNMFDPSVGTQSITYSVGTVPCNDVLTQTINVGVQTDATWSAPTGLCTASPQVDLSTYITGTTGGTFSGTGISGNMFDPSVGTQTITYSVGIAPCDDQLDVTINVAALPNGSWTVPTGLCIGDAPIDLTAYITGDLGGTWTGTGMTGSTFDPASGTQSITYEVGTVPCNHVVTQTINVVTLPDPNWTIPTNICETDAPFDLTPFVTGNPGGVWSGTGISGNMFDPSVGTQSITYTVGSGSCMDLLAQTITVSTMPDPSWTTTLMCTSSAPINLDNLITGTTGGTWSGTGVTGNVFDPTNGSQSVTYTVTSGACIATSAQTISAVTPAASATSTNASCFGLADGTASASATGGSGNYTYSWNTTPAQASANATGLAAGTYTVTVTDVDAGCTTTADVTIIEPTQILLTLTPTNVCAPALGSASVSASGGVGGFTYNWSPVPSTASTVDGVDSAMATVVVTDGNGCVVTDSVFVTVYPQPTIVISPDTLIYWGDFALLTASGGIGYNWSPNADLSCDDCPNPVATPDIPTTYCVTVTDMYGCINDACTFVDIELVCGEVFVPTAFSPNDDGENDFLCVYTDCWDQLTFTVYNRWGEKVFQNSSEDICWDGTWNGKELNPAVFVYTVDGRLLNGQVVSLKGNVSLVK
ncbi:MAG: gliding motility-associated C-terminal domain-containing protein [Crocinitomicaceae bacterium]|nr:gliding motility-associated C-terminal domain-containing protein [Crocinitomicaceae bacterium]